MITETKERRSNLLVVRLTDSEMQKVRDLKKSNRTINVSFIVRNHLMKVIEEATKVIPAGFAKYPISPLEAFSKN